MRHSVIVILFLALIALPGLAQRSRPQTDQTPDQNALPSQEKLLKLQFEETKKMSSRLTELATDVEADLDKAGQNVLPLGTIKKLDEIEKLAKKLRGRLKQQ